jgi:hypothetical protein
MVRVSLRSAINVQGDQNRGAVQQSIPQLPPRVEVPGISRKRWLKLRLRKLGAFRVAWKPYHTAYGSTAPIPPEKCRIEGNVRNLSDETTGTVIGYMRAQTAEYSRKDVLDENSPAN